MHSWVKYVFPLAFGAAGIATMAVASVFVGLLFVAAGIAGFIVLKSMDDLGRFSRSELDTPTRDLSSGLGSSPGVVSSPGFDTAFFVASKIDGPTGRHGRFRKIQATVKDVEVHSASRGQEIGFTCEGVEEDTDAVRTFVSAPALYEFNGRVIGEDEAHGWDGRTVGVVYDTENLDDFTVDSGPLFRESER